MRIVQNKSWLAPLIVILIFVGCAVGPNFKSPKVVVPAMYIYDSVNIKIDTLVNLMWWDNFGDTTLNFLIREALRGNRNLAIAASRIEQSRLQLRMVRSEIWPSFGFGVEGKATSAGNSKVIQQYSIQPNVKWELDLFGKLRRTSESAHAQMLATEENYRSVMLSLVAEVATTYFNLLQYDMLLQVSLDTYNIRHTSQNIIDSLYYYGMSSSVDLEQARSLTATAAAAIPQYKRAKVQTEMSLCALLGKTPYSIVVDGMRLFSEKMIPKLVPSGLPSSLLNRRPDIRESYYQVASATSNVAVAVANRYPTVVLTGEGGLLSSSLKGLLNGSPFGWSASLSISESVFSFGKNKRAVEVAKEKELQAILNYEQSVITALGEVENALAGVATYRLEVERYHELLKATQKTQVLTGELYRGGYNTYLDVLDAERELFSTQINFSAILFAQLAEYVELYKALGGGW